MFAPENFDATATETTSNLASMILALPVKHKEIPCPGQQTVLPDGSKVVTNKAGEVIFVDYSTGATIMRFENYVVCTNEMADHWFRSSNMTWMRLD
jgi:hypothetical protein